MPENTGLPISSPSGPGRKRWHPKEGPPLPSERSGGNNEDDLFNLVCSSSAEGLSWLQPPHGDRIIMSHRCRDKKRKGRRGTVPRDQAEHLGSTCRLYKECCPRAQRVEPRPPLRVVMIPVWGDAIEIHLPTARPQRSPLLRVYIGDCAHHVSAVLCAPATTTGAGDAGYACVAAACGAENGGGVDVRVVQEVSRRF